MTQRNNKADRTEMGAHKNARILQRQLKEGDSKRQRKERERRARVLEFGLEFSKPAHTRPQMPRTQALIIIQNWTFRLTHSPLDREKNMKKETNNREKKQTSNTFDQSHVTWGQLGDVGLGSWRGSTRRDRNRKAGRQAGRRCQADRSQASGSFLTRTITHNLFHFIKRERERERE